MTGFSDFADLGVFVLQDHAAALDGTPISARQMLAGGRLVRMSDPSQGGGSESASARFGKDSGLGTLGDIHPWLFWQTRDRSVRGIGSWAQLFHAVAMSDATGGGVPRMNPLRDSEYKSDSRYTSKSPSWPVGFPRVPRGALLTIAPGTDESAQHDLGFWADPRLVAPNAAGPGECGSLVCDLGPAGELCMDGAEIPGVGGRHARLQTLVRVIATAPGAPFANLDGNQGNVLALNFAATGADGIPAYGPFFGLVDGGGGGGTSTGVPTTGGGGPITGPHGVTLSDASAAGRVGNGTTKIGGNAFGAALAGGEDEKKPNGFGAFVPNPTGSHAVALMAAVGAYGPLHTGSRTDKHRHGTDRDGHPINSAHLSTLAFWYQSQSKDAPLLFEGDYPNARPYPFPSRAHISYDVQSQHAFKDGVREGYWRLWAEVPDFAPDTPNSPPSAPPTGGPPPTRPKPPGGPPPGVPPTGAPPTGAPPTGAPPTGVPPTGGPTPPKPGLGRPITPNPGGKRFPGYPPTPYDPPDPNGPATPGGGTPTGPTRPGGGPGGSLCTEPLPQPDPNRPAGPTRSGALGPSTMPALPLPHVRRELLETGVAPREFASNAGGAGGGGSRVVDPRIDLGRWSGLDPWTRQPAEVPGLVERIGGEEGRTALYTIWRPLAQGFGALLFRPQLTVRGYPNFERNPQLPEQMFRNDEATRPQSVAMRAWGAQAADGDWRYTEAPMLARARGGTVDGGVMFAPPRFDLADYFGIGGQNVDDTTSAQATVGHVLMAPGVRLAWGKPASTGGLQAGGFTAHPVAGKWTLAQDGVELVEAIDDGTDVLVRLGRGGTAAVSVPVGTTAQRPTTLEAGQVRFNSTTGQLECYNGSAWSSGGGGGGAAWGSITGTLSAQTDLWTALGAKLDTANVSYYRRVVFHGTLGTNFTATNMTAAARFLNGSVAGIVLADLQNCTQVRLSARVATAGFAGSRITLHYSKTYSGTFGDYSAMGDSGAEVAVSMTTATIVSTGWVDMDATAAAEEVYLALGEVDGNGTADPAIRWICAEFR